MPALIRPTELAVVLGRITGPDHLTGIAERLSKAISAPLEIHGVEFAVKVYSSTIYCNKRGVDPQELLEIVCRAARNSMETDSDTIAMIILSEIP